MRKDLENVIGKICPLCKKGIIMYVKFNLNGGLFSGFAGGETEFTTCTNKKCDAYVDAS